MIKVEFDKIRAWKSDIQEKVSETTNLVEAKHQEIATKPYELIEKVSFLSGPAEYCKSLQTNITAKGYQLLRDVNTALGNFSTTLLDALESRVSKEEAPAKAE